MESNGRCNLWLGKDKILNIVVGVRKKLKRGWEIDVKYREKKEIEKLGVKKGYCNIVKLDIVWEKNE